MSGKFLDSINRLKSINWCFLFSQFFQAFQSAYYKEEISQIHDAIEAEDFKKARQLLCDLELIVGSNHPDILYMGTCITLLE